jgi:hypothetical protein
MNVMHASIEITDQFYSVQNDAEVKERIEGLAGGGSTDSDTELLLAFQDFLKNYRRKR